MPPRPAAEILDFATAAAWEAWLAEHHARASGAWLKIAKQGAAGLTILEAAAAAMCYGWIDSQRRGLDQTHFLQRYSPRRPRSPWSQINVQRAEALLAAGRMQPAGLAEIEAAKADGRWAAAYAPQRDVRLPPALAEALARNDDAHRAFEQLDKTAQYALILPILKAATDRQRAGRVARALRQLAP
jgi:uncharacterized protein YdeI (YjbR/CyaY-like superfamily)